jgi:hypothetical protein
MFCAFRGRYQTLADGALIALARSVCPFPDLFYSLTSRAATFLLSALCELAKSLLKEDISAALEGCRSLIEIDMVR